MNDFIFYKQPTRNTFEELVPSRRVIENILNYSRSMQVQNTPDLGLLVFFNN